LHARISTPRGVMPVMLNYNPNFLKVAKLIRRSVIGRLGPEGYVDSDFTANLDKRISLTGYVFIRDVLSVGELIYSLQ
jgi:hypothetical protein